MPQTLQRNARTDGALGRDVRTTALILDADYCEQAIALLRLAQSEVRLCAYAWRWYENEPEIGIQKFNVELYKLRHRGVKVRCLVDTDALRMRFATLGFNTRSVINTRMLHTKAVAVDATGLIIGSHNLTKRANTDNYEASIKTYEFQVVDSFNNYFDRLWDSRG